MTIALTLGALIAWSLFGAGVAVGLAIGLIVGRAWGLR